MAVVVGSAPAGTEVGLVTRNIPSGTQTISGAVTLPGSLTGKAEDSVAAGADPGLAILGVRNDAAASKTDADGDYSMVATDAAGRVGVADLGGSITVDAPVGTPVATRLSDGAAFLTTPSGRLAVEDVGNVAHDGTDSGNPVKIGGKATSMTATPTPVSTVGDRVDAWYDTQGAAVVRGGLRVTYTAAYRLTSRPYALSKATGGAGIFQFATIYHANTATKTVRIKRVRVWLKNNSAAATLMFELRRLSAATAPATGNPAITALAHNSVSGAAEVTTLALPTTAGSEANANAGWGTQEIAMGITGAASTVNPPPSLDAQVITLYDDTPMGEREDLIIRAGVAEGYAVIVDASASTTVLLTAEIQFTEE